jgi:hypothetical protein
VLSPDRIAALVPDRSSLDAARKLLQPGNWPLRAREAAGGLVWGECQGSASAPYRICLDSADLGSRCSCPSRKFPCKHALALMWLFAERPGEFQAGEPPDWVREWVGKRRGKAAGTGKAAAGETSETPGQAPAAPCIGLEPLPEAPQEISFQDEKAEAKSRAQRERLRQAREEAILSGLDDLDRWIADRLEAGLAGFAAAAPAQCRMTARRLVDAKAPGLAALVDEIPQTLLSLPEPMRTPYLVETLGGLHLLACAYRNQESLPPGLREDVRRLIGWTVERASLLADPASLRGEAVWRVVGQRSEIRPDGLRSFETWLAACDRPESGIPGFALLLDFAPVSAGPIASPFEVGEAFRAGLVFYPSAAPLRAVIASRLPGPVEDAVLHGAASLAEALDAYDAVLAVQPFAGTRPLAVSGARIEDGRDGLVLTDAAGAIALPFRRSQETEILPLAGNEITAVGLWDGRFFSLLAAETPLGPWHEG